MMKHTPIHFVPDKHFFDEERSITCQHFLVMESSEHILFCFPKRNYIICDISMYSLEAQQRGKISIQQFAENERFSFSQKPIPALRNHITWEDQESLPLHVLRQGEKSGTRKVRRRKIFQRLEDKGNRQEYTRGHMEASRSRQKWMAEGSQLRKVKSDHDFLRNKTGRGEENTIETKIEEINRKLLSKKAQKAVSYDSFSQSTSHFHPQPQPQPQPESRQQLKQLQKQLSESTFLLNKHEEVLHQKLPAFQKKLDQNNQAISEMEKLVRTRLELDKKRNTNLHELAHLADSKLRGREEELGKLNSSLLQKETELLRHKEENRKRELELMRIKRIEDLQKNNLQLYQAIERRKGFGHFQSLVENREELVEGQCWEDDSEGSGIRPLGGSPFRLRQGQSSIKFNQGEQSSIKFESNQLEVSVNNTIGEILSPLVLSQYQYCL